MINQNFKKKAVIVLSAFILLSLFVGSACAYTGSGTQNDPYILYNAQDLAILDTYPSAYFELGGDIECGGNSYGGYAATNGFSGHLDGKSHKIVYDVSGTSGLFDTLNGGEIKNLTFTACSFTGASGGAVAGKVTGSDLTLIENVNVIYSNINGNGDTGYYQKGGIVGLVDGGNVKITNCAVQNSKVRSTSRSGLGASAYGSDTGGIIGRANGSNVKIEVTDCYLLNDNIEAGKNSSGIIGSLGNASFSSLTIKNNTLENCYIFAIYSSTSGDYDLANGILFYASGTAVDPLDVYIESNTLFNCLINGDRGASGISYQSSSGNLRPHYVSNVIRNTTIYQSGNSNGNVSGDAYYAGGMHGNGSIGNYSSYYDNNYIGNSVIYAAHTNAIYYGAQSHGYANLFAPPNMVYSEYKYNTAEYVDIGSAGTVQSRTLPSITEGNSYHDIDDYTTLVSLDGMIIETDSENLKSKTFTAVQRGAVLVHEALSYAEGYGVKPEYKWDYTGDGTVDSTTETYYQTYTYTTDGEFHPTLTVRLFDFATNVQTSADLSTEYMGAPKFVEGANITKSKDIQTYGQNVRLTANTVSGYGGATYEFFYSLDNGETWTSYAEESPYSYKDITYISQDTETTFIKYRVVATNAYGETTSEPLNFLWTPSTITSETVTKEYITGENDTYAVTYSIQFPFDTIKTESYGSYYTLITTKNAIYLVQNNVENETQVIKGKLEVLDAYIVDSDFYGGNLVYRTDDNRAFYSTVTEDLGFTTPTQLTLMGDTVSQCSIGTNSYLFRSVTDTQEYIEIIFFGETESEFVITPDIPFKYNNWTLAKYSSDNSNTPAVFCSYSNGTQKILRCYTGANQYFDSEAFTANTITSIKAFANANKVVLTTNGGRSFIVPYTLTSTRFSWGNVMNADDIVLTDVTPTDYDIRYIGINSPSTVVFIASSSGQLEATFPVSSTLTSVDISGVSGLYAIAGDYDGRINILNNGASSWSSIQNFSVGHTIVDTSISPDYLSLSALTSNKVYLAKYQNYTPPSGDTVLVTKIFVKVIVYDGNGAPLPNTPVSMIGGELANTLTTGYDGSATFEVTSGKQYTIQTNGMTKVFVADNTALRTIPIYLPKINYYDDLKFDSEETNDNITISFVGNGKEHYNITLKVYDENNQGIINQTITDIESHTFTIVKSQYNVKRYDCTVTVTGLTSTITVSRVYTYSEEYQRSPSGYIILGDIPILPDIMDSNWVKVLFGGLLMIIGGLFSARHSAKGCVIVVVVAAFLTFAGILPLNPVWIGCLIVLAILTLYSFASSQET